MGFGSWRERESGLGSQRPEMDGGLGGAKIRREQRQAGMILRDGTRVQGTIHFPPHFRPLDLLNSKDEAYMAVTNGSLLDTSGKRMELPFIAVNKADVVVLFELQQDAAA